MSEFETWFAIYRPSLDTSAIEAEFIFETGAQSKQAEIDELRNKVASVLEYINGFDPLDIEHDTDVNNIIYEIEEILKGTTNEQ